MTLEPVRRVAEPMTAQPKPVWRLVVVLSVALLAAGDVGLTLAAMGGSWTDLIP